MLRSEASLLIRDLHGPRGGGGGRGARRSPGVIDEGVRGGGGGRSLNERGAGGVSSAGPGGRGRQRRSGGFTERMEDRVRRRFEHE